VYVSRNASVFVLIFRLIIKDLEIRIKKVASLVDLSESEHRFLTGKWLRFSACYNGKQSTEESLSNRCTCEPCKESNDRCN